MASPPAAWGLWKAVKGRGWKRGIGVCVGVILSARKSYPLAKGQSQLTFFPFSFLVGVVGSAQSY